MSSAVTAPTETLTPAAAEQLSELESLRVAIVHHWFVTLGGGERVVSTIASMFPKADLFTFFLHKQKLPSTLRRHKITTSFLNKIPASRRVHRYLLPFYPLAVEWLDLSGYDLIITSDSGPMKGVITDRYATHICWCYSPMRYLWDAHSAYLGRMSRLTRTLFRPVSHYVRNWDYAAAQRVDRFIAISRYIARRIHKYYRRDSTVIHCPVNTSQGFLTDKPEDYYLTVGRLVPYKRTDILIDACCKLGRKLVIIGDGPEMKRLRQRSGKNIEFLGEVSDAELRNFYAHCRAFLFAADEDFGLVPLEAHSYGRPVIAFGKGGALETVAGSFTPARHRENTKGPTVTGVFFSNRTADSLAEAILAFESQEKIFVPEHIQLHARQFDSSVFIDRMRSYIKAVIADKTGTI